MKIILETERLYLREFIPSDGYHFYCLNSDEDVIKYTGNKPFKSISEAMIFIKDYSDYKRNGYGRQAVCLKETNVFLGWCGLKFENGEIDLGYRFYKKYWGIGYATESAKACIDFGFSKLNIQKIVGRAHIKNVASIEVLKKCSFKFKKQFLQDNQPTTLYILENDTN